MKKLIALLAGILLLYRLLQVDPVAKGILDRIKTIILFDNPAASKVQEKINE